MAVHQRKRKHKSRRRRDTIQAAMADGMPPARRVRRRRSGVPPNFRAAFTVFTAEDEEDSILAPR